MSSPYSMGAFPQGNFRQGYEAPPRNNVKQPSVFGAAATGFVAGGVFGYYKNRYPVKDGVVSDEFASNALDKFIDKGYAKENKNFYKQMRKVMKKVGKIKSPEKFKKLLSKNPEVCKRVYNTVSFDTVCETVNHDNVRVKADALKKALEAERNIGIVNIKDAAVQYWDETAKKFVKPKKTKDIKTYKAIKSAKASVQWKKALKFGGIAAGIFGALTIGYRMLLAKSQPLENIQQGNFSPQQSEFNYTGQI